MAERRWHDVRTLTHNRNLRLLGTGIPSCPCPINPAADGIEHAADCRWGVAMATSRAVEGLRLAGSVVEDLGAEVAELRERAWWFFVVGAMVGVALTLAGLWVWEVWPW